MEILGIGFPELVFIFVIAIIVMGPKDMQKAGKTVGKWLRKIVTSDGWRIFQQTSRELRTLPNRLMREANEELELNQIGRDVKNPMDTLNAKYPPPQKSQPAVTAPSGMEYPAPSTEPQEPESQADESDSPQDA